MGIEKQRFALCFLAMVVEVVWSELPLAVPFWSKRVQPCQERNCCFLGLFFTVLESQNHINSWVERDLEDHLVPTPTNMRSSPKGVP